MPHTQILQATLIPAMAGAVVVYSLPILLVVFAVLLMRARRRQELSEEAAQRGAWAAGAGLLALALTFSAAVPALLLLGWASIGVSVVAAALWAALLRQSLGRALRGVTWALLVATTLLVVCFPFDLWLASTAKRIVGYSNFNEKEVRIALAKNPDDAAAHSSLAQINMMRGDHTGEMAEWRQVLRVEPHNDEALFLLGGRLAQTGRAEEARPLYQRLAAGNGPYAASARRWLAQHGVQ